MLGVSATVSMSIKEITAYRKQQSRAGLQKLVPSVIAALRSNEEFKSAIRQSPLLPPLKFIRSSLPNSFRRKKNKGADSTPTSAASTMEGPLFIPPEFYVRYLAARTEYSNEKIKQMLGYSPKYDLAKGMAVTEEWAKWANLL